MGKVAFTHPPTFFSTSSKQLDHLSQDTADRQHGRFDLTTPMCSHSNTQHLRLYNNAGEISLANRTKVDTDLEVRLPYIMHVSPLEKGRMRNLKML